MIPCLLSLQSINPLIIGVMFINYFEDNSFVRLHAFFFWLSHLLSQLGISFLYVEIISHYITIMIIFHSICHSISRFHVRLQCLSHLDYHE